MTPPIRRATVRRPSMEWLNCESQVFTVDPDDLKSGQDGSYRLAKPTFTLDSVTTEVIEPDPGISVVPLSNGGALVNIALTSGGADTFVISASVTIGIPELDSNAPGVSTEIGKWKLRIVQDVIEHESTNIIWEERTRRFSGAPVPGTDLPDGGFPSSTFTGGERTQSIEYTDTPNSSAPAWGLTDLGNPGVYAVNPLDKVSRGPDIFKTWVYVEREGTGERIFLHWVKWKVQYDVDFTVTPSGGQANVQHAKDVWILQEIGEGPGAGDSLPADEVFDLSIDLIENEE